MRQKLRGLKRAANKASDVCELISTYNTLRPEVKVSVYFNGSELNSTSVSIIIKNLGLISTDTSKPASRCLGLQRQDFSSGSAFYALNFLVSHVSLNKHSHHGYRNVCIVSIDSERSHLANIMLCASFNSTYYGKDYRAGAALLRARRPYLFKNTITGFGLFAFTIAVCE